jgi:hypothetical protein
MSSIPQLLQCVLTLGGSARGGPVAGEPDGLPQRGPGLRIPRGRFLPCIALDRQLIAQCVQLAHVLGVEVILVFGLEGGRDIGQVVVHAIALRDEVDAIEVTDAL